MYDRFTDRARKVMQLAEQNARRGKCEYVGTEHLLLALVEEGSGVAFKVLRNLGVDPERIKREIWSIIPPSSPESAYSGKLPNVPRVENIIQFAIDEARFLRHNYVGTEHLLLGILREPGCVASQILLNLGLKPADVRQQVLSLLGRPLAADRERLAASMHYQVVNLKGVTIPKSVVELVPESVARENCLIPLSFENGLLQVAVAMVDDIDTFEKLVFILSFNIEPVLADREDLLAAIDRHYGAKGSDSGS
jgi:hypothetical protein